MAKYGDTALVSSARKAANQIARHERELLRTNPQAQRSIMVDIQKHWDRMMAIWAEVTRRSQ